MSAEALENFLDDSWPLSGSGKALVVRVLAEALTAAGWRPPPRRIDTVEELRALPDGAVVKTRHVSFEITDGVRELTPEFWLEPDNGPVFVIHEGR